VIEKAPHLKKKCESHWTVLMPVGWGPAPCCRKGLQGVGVLPLSWLSSTSRHTIWPLLIRCTGLLHLMTSTNKALLLLTEVFAKIKPKRFGRSQGYLQAYHFVGVVSLSGWEWVFLIIMVGN